MPKLKTWNLKGRWQKSKKDKGERYRLIGDLFIVGAAIFFFLGLAVAARYVEATAPLVADGGLAATTAFLVQLLYVGGVPLALALVLVLVGLASHIDALIEDVAKLKEAKQ